MVQIVSEEVSWLTMNIFDYITNVRIYPEYLQIAIDKAPTSALAEIGDHGTATGTDSCLFRLDLMCVANGYYGLGGLAESWPPHLV